MSDDSELDPMDEDFIPLAVAVGRLVLGAAALEKVLLVDIAMRLFHSPLAGELAAELTAREKHSAGKLLERLRELGIPTDLSNRVGRVIEGRNRVVHHLMEDLAVVEALASGEGMDQVVAGIDSIAIDCQQVINELTAVTFPTLEADLGKPLPELVEMIGSIDLATVDDPTLQSQIHFARLVKDALDWEHPQPSD